MLSKERFAWAWISALVVIFGTYFTVVSVQPHRDLPFRTQIGLLAAAMIALAIVSLVARFALPRGADDSGLIDERDRRIEARSTTAAYRVLIGGMIVVGCVMPFTADGWDIVHAALHAIALAEIVHHALIVAGYRRGFSV